MSSDDVIDALFNRTVAIAQSLPPAGPIQTSYEEKLALYSLYKQATEGDVSTPRPRLLDMLGRAKWDAWATRRGLSPRDAKQLYVESMLRTLRRYRDRPQAIALIDELENFSGQVAEQVMDSALASTDDDYSGSEETGDGSQYDEYDDEDGGEDDEDDEGHDAAQPLHPRTHPCAPVAASQTRSTGSAGFQQQYRRQVELGTPLPAQPLPQQSFGGVPAERSTFSPPPYGQGQGFPPQPPPSTQLMRPPSLTGSLVPGAVPRQPPIASPRYPASAQASPRPPVAGVQLDSVPQMPVSEGRLYGLPGRSPGYPPSESLAGQAAGGFHTPQGLYRPPGAPPGASSYSYAASSVGGKSANILRRPAQGEPRLARISDTGSGPPSARDSATARADAVDLALQRIQASLAGLHERMTAVEQGPSSTWFPLGSAAASAGTPGNPGAGGALSQLWRAIQNAGHDISFLLGISTVSGTSPVAATGFRRGTHAGGRTVRGALGNVFLSAPLRIMVALLYLCARLALDVLSVSLLVTGLLLLIRRLSGRGDPLILFRLLRRWTQALRTSKSGAPVAAAGAAGFAVNGR